MQGNDKIKNKKLSPLQQQLQQDLNNRTFSSAEIHPNDGEVVYQQGDEAPKRGRFGRMKDSLFQEKMVENQGDRHFASAEIHHNDGQSKQKPAQQNHDHYLGQNHPHNIADQQGFTAERPIEPPQAEAKKENIFKKIGGFFLSIYQEISRKITYYQLKLEQINVLNTNLKQILSSLFLICFIVAAVLLYRNGTISEMRQNIVNTLGEWAGDAGVNVQEVVSTGRQHASQNDILEALNVEIGTPLLSFDVDAAKARIERIGWIETANVQRSFPDKLEVTIDEREPFAIWQINGDHVLVDRNGIVVSDKIIRGYHLLPLIVGKGAASEALSLLGALEERVEIFQNVRALVRVGERRWDLDLKNGMRILLPAENPEAMLADLERMMKDHNILKRGITKIDFRLSDRVRFEMDEATATDYFANQEENGEKTKIQ